MCFVLDEGLLFSTLITHFIPIQYSGIGMEMLCPCPPERQDLFRLRAQQPTDLWGEGEEFEGNFPNRFQGLPEALTSL